MASIGNLEIAKDGRRFWLIRVRMGRNDSQRKTRFYWPDGYSEKVAIRQRDKFAAEFERQCKAGAVLSRKQKEEKEASQKAELAKLKNVRQYVESVFMPSKEVSVTENTRANYQQFFDKHIFPAIGDMLLTDVSPAIIKKLLIDYQKAGYAHASCIKLYNILNGLFEMAFLDDSIPISPMLKVKRPVPNKDIPTTPEADKALTAQELDFVLSCAGKEPLKWQTYMELSADTGARRGELCGLQWQDIDWSKKTITISRNLQYTAQAGVYEATPKNGKVRTVDIGDSAIILLRKLRAEQAGQRLSKWVFTQEGADEPIHPQSPTRYFKKFGGKYGIPNFHPHMLRHTSASVAITHGADVVSVSQRLGHSDTAVTLRMYAHANDESIRAAGQTVRDAVKASRAKNEAAES